MATRKCYQLEMEDKRVDCLRKREKRPREKKKSATTKCQKYSMNSNKDTLYLHNDFLPKNS